MAHTRSLRILAGIACLILAFAAGATGLMMGFLGTRREADIGSPLALLLALLLAIAGVGLISARGR